MSKICQAQVNPVNQLLKQLKLRNVRFLAVTATLESTDETSSAIFPSSQVALH
jgi:hypothetical protein